MGIELRLGHYISTIKTLIDAVYFTRTGNIHPEILTSQRLKSIIKQFIERYPHYEFPIPIDEVYTGELGRMSHMTSGYHNGKLILVMHIPLLERRTFGLYMMHPCPTPQVYGQNNNGSAHIIPRTTYIALSDDQEQYFLFNNEYLDRCYHTRRFFICKPEHPLYDVNAHPTCESSLLITHLKKPFKNCDIRINGKQEHYWRRLNSLGGWLFSLPQSEWIKVICSGKRQEVIQINGAGILQLHPGCTVRTTYATMSGLPKQYTTEEVIYAAVTNLNISELSPNIINYYNLSSIQMPAERPQITVTELEHPSTGISLSEIEADLWELSTHKRSRQLNIVYSHATAGGLLTLTLIFIGYICRGYILMALTHLRTTCRKSTDNKHAATVTHSEESAPTQTLLKKQPGPLPAQGSFIA